MKSICIVAGKSGGHIVPGLTIAQHEKKNTPDLTVLFFTTNSPLDKKIVDDAPLSLHHCALSLSAIPYRKPWLFPLFFFTILRSLIVSYIQLIRHKPSKIMSMGAVVSLPVCLVAFILRIPIHLYELNAVPGSAVKFLARFATTIHICFEQAQTKLPAHKCVVTPYPIRYSTTALQLSKYDACQRLGIAPNKKTILVLGGSQGSHFINMIIKQLFEHNQWLATQLYVIHQTGSDNSTQWESWYREHRISTHTFSYHNDLTTYYRAADLVICRSGAGTLFETLFFNVPFITIPLETQTTDHQIYNAHALKEKFPELVQVLEQKDVEKNSLILLDTICSLLPDINQNNKLKSSHNIVFR